MLKKFFIETGRYFLFLRIVFKKPEKWKIFWKQFFVEADKLIVSSVVLVSVISLFIGGVLVIQTASNMNNPFLDRMLVGYMVRESLILEFCSTMVALILAGKIGSNIASELGSMRISDQIDALEVMDINPIGYLVTPRLLSSLVAFPLLTSIFTVVGIFGGYLSACVLLGLNEGRYFSGIESSVTLDDVQGCCLKAAVFAVIVIIVCCFQGYNAHRRSDGKGAEAVGNATTSAVVMSCVLILMADYVLTSFLL